MTEPRRSCPSASGTAGATLLGIVGPGGRVVFTPRGPKLTESLRDQLESTGSGQLESRFRFTAPCVQSACVFWDGSCRAVQAAHEDFDGLAATSEPAALPECGIRDSCRWWHQEGPAACQVCPYVRTA